jgi:hypothetical protein
MAESDEVRELDEEVRRMADEIREWLSRDMHDLEGVWMGVEGHGERPDEHWLQDVARVAADLAVGFEHLADRAEEVRRKLEELEGLEDEEGNRAPLKRFTVAPDAPMRRIPVYRLEKKTVDPEAPMRTIPVYPLEKKTVDPDAPPEKLG